VQGSRRQRSAARREIGAESWRHADEHDGPNNRLLEKLRSNLAEVRARGGELFVFADAAAGITEDPARGALLRVNSGGNLIAPMVFTVPLQLLAYHVAVLRGTDVDQPRNLAKSVTVE